MTKSMPLPNSFLGYPRADDSVGIRNHLLVISVTGLTGPTARRIGQTLRGSQVVDMPYGSGHLGIDAVIQQRALAGLALNPNVGAALVIGADRPVVESVCDTLTHFNRRCVGLVLDDFEHDALSLTDAGIRRGAHLLRELSAQKREHFAFSKLVVGLECGRSDPSSGLVANPLVGRMSDYLVDEGATVMFGETTEWMGAEHILAARASSKETAQAIVDATNRREQQARAAGVDIVGTNPGPTNIESGLTTIEEKSVGAIAKSGNRPIKSVIGYGEKPTSKGLYAMDAAAYAPESITGFVASGAQLLLFTTGAGNSYVNRLAPTIKISANPRTGERLTEQIDYTCPAVFGGVKTVPDMLPELANVVENVASGMLTWGEILGEDGVAISRYGQSL